MAIKEPLPMHTDFARWHASIGLGDDELRRQSRWAGVSAVAQAADSKDVEALIRLAFKSRQPAAAAEVLKIREAFNTADATFEMQGNDRELQVLAAASLTALMNAGASTGAEAALAVTTASLVGERKPDLPMDLRVLAESAIDQIAETNRKRPNLSTHTSTDVPKLDFEKSAAHVKTTPNWDGVAQAFAMAADATRVAVGNVVRRQANAVHAMDKFLRVQDEELQMLWWLTGQRSFDLDCTFDTVPVDAQPLVFGKELAGSTEYLPGPASVKALLSRAGLKDRKKIALSATINAADAAWLQTFVPDGEPSPVSTPIHYGIKRQLETGAGDTWIPGWAAAVGVTATFAATPLMLGLLFYRERLLLLFGNK
jgi:GTPase-associated system helical domain